MVEGDGSQRDDSSGGWQPGSERVSTSTQNTLVDVLREEHSLKLKEVDKHNKRQHGLATELKQRN